MAGDLQHQVRRCAIAAALAGSVVLTGALTPSAWASYPGRNGKLAYRLETADSATGNIQFSDISSIPQDSGANCTAPDGIGNEPAPCTLGRFSYSPDGRQIVAEVDGTSLEVLNASGRHVSKLPLLTQQDKNPAFVPGGRTLVFEGTENKHTNLYEVRVNGTHLTQLTKSGGSWPAPCENGSIAYIGDNGALYLRGPHGHTRLLVAHNATKPDCSPNSRSVIYETAGGQDRIVRIADGRSTKVHGQAYDCPVFSPDGKRIASVSSYNQVLVITLSGRTVSRRSPAAETVFLTTWQPLPRR